MTAESDANPIQHYCGTDELETEANLRKAIIKFEPSAGLLANLSALHVRPCQFRDDGNGPVEG